MITLDDSISRVIYHGQSRYSEAGTFFAILRLAGGSTAKGTMSRPLVGQDYTFYGDWRDGDQKYPGKFFAFDGYEARIDRSPSGYAAYLARTVPGIGPKVASRIADTFGDDVFRVCACEPERLSEVAGVTPKIVEAVRECLAEDPLAGAAYAAIAEIVRGSRVRDSVVRSLVARFGSDAPDIVRKNPYILTSYPSVGWKTSDEIALKNVGIDRDAPCRHAAAVAEAVSISCGDGHTYTRLSDAESRASLLLGRPLWEGAVDAASESGSVRPIDVGGVPVLARERTAAAEDSIARDLARILAARKAPVPAEIDTSGLEPMQVEAVRRFSDSGVLVLAGAPGTGKTFVSTKILTSLCNDITTLVVAPTGKAATRAAELVAQHAPGSWIVASTIHKALEPRPGGDEPEGIPSADAKANRGRSGFSFQRNRANPLDYMLICLDEASMADVEVAAALLEAVPDGARLLVVGDPNQLPPVGPGCFLRDLIDGGFPSVTLEKVRRAVGHVVESCHKIKDGKIPRPCRSLDLESGENWAHFPAGTPAEIGKIIVDLFSNYIAKATKGDGWWSGVSPLWGVQVISPQKSIPHIGTVPLNDALARVANPSGRRDGDEYEHSRFSVGDKVIRSEKNQVVDGIEEDHEGTIAWLGRRWSSVPTPVVNGDMGIVKDICKFEDSQAMKVVVEFRNPSRLVVLPYAKCSLDLAYAVTTHKAQGSGFDVVIAPVHDSFYFDSRKCSGLWCREMIYTIFSRTQGFLVTVGDVAAVGLAASRRTIHRRETRLSGLIHEMLK